MWPMGRSLPTADTEEREVLAFQGVTGGWCVQVWTGPTGHLLSSEAVKRTMDHVRGSAKTMQTHAVSGYSEDKVPTEGGGLTQPHTASVPYPQDICNTFKLHNEYKSLRGWRSARFWTAKTLGDRIPGGSVDKTELSMPRVCAQSLVGKLRSHKVRGLEKFKKEIRKTPPPPPPAKKTLGGSRQTGISQRWNEPCMKQATALTGAKWSASDLV